MSRDSLHRSSFNFLALFTATTCSEAERAIIGDEYCEDWHRLLLLAIYRAAKADQLPELLNHFETSLRDLETSFEEHGKDTPNV